MVDLVDEEHSKEFEELKIVAEAAQGVSAGLVGRCPTATHLSLPLSRCPSAVATYVLLVFKSPFIYIRTFAVVGIISRMYVRIYSTYVCTYVCASLCLTISVRTYMFVSVCVCVCMLSCSPALSGQVYVCTVNTYTKGGCVVFNSSTHLAVILHKCDYCYVSMNARTCAMLCVLPSYLQALDNRMQQRLSQGSSSSEVKPSPHLGKRRYIHRYVCTDGRMCICMYIHTYICSSCVC